MTGLSGPYGFTSEGRTGVSVRNIRYDFSSDAVGGLSFGAFTISTQDSLWGIIGNAARAAGLGNLVTQAQNAAAVRTTLEGVVSNGLAIVKYGADGLSDPNFDAGRYDRMVGDYLRGTQDQLGETLQDITMFPNNPAAEAVADRILGGARLIGTVARDGVIPLEAAVRMGVELQVGDHLNAEWTFTGTVNADLVFDGFGDSRMDGGEGNDVLSGGGGNDALSGGDGRDYLNGGNGMDVLDGGAGDDRLEGGAGMDIAVASGNRAEWGVRHQGNGLIALVGNGDVDTLSGIERVRFADGTLVVDPADPAFSVYRLYEAALDRAPDEVGLTAWTYANTTGMGMEEMAGRFMAAPEFAQRFGTPDNAGFVDLLYRNVLDRPADATGASGWLGALEGGALSREQVLLQFSDSVENVNKVNAGVGDGVWLA